MRLYIETSVPNFLFATDAPDKRAATEEMSEQLRQGLHQAVVSDLYFLEVARVSVPLLRYQLQEVPQTYGLAVLPFNEESELLTQAYLDSKAFTELNWLDASHVATAAHHGCEVIVSWNFQHIVRAWTMKRVAEVHHRLGLAPILICTPLEVIGHD